MTEVDAGLQPPLAGAGAGADGVALWRQIVTTMTQEIRAGRPEAGARLPTEGQLALRFGVNRHTLRRAMEELQRAGLVRVERGRGAFVAEDVLEYAVETRTRFSEWIRRHNKEPSGKTLRLDELPLTRSPLDRQVALALGLRAGARVVALRRLAFADERPVGVGTHYFPSARLPGLAAALAECDGITAALARVGVADYIRQSTRVTARMPTAEEATLLRTPSGRPLLVCENINIDGAGRVTEFCISAYPTPRVQIAFEP